MNKNSNDKIAKMIYLHDVSGMLLLLKFKSVLIIQINISFYVIKYSIKIYF